MSLKDLFGDSVKGKHGEVALFDGEIRVVGIYFSAHWCPPCRAFTPKLADWYNRQKHGPDGAKLEIVFVSADRDEPTFNGYYDQQPWLAVPFSDKEKKDQLSEKFSVSGIPMLVFVTDKGDIISTDGRALVMSDTTVSKLITS